MATDTPSTASALERENHSRDADFNRAMHGKSSNQRGGLASLMQKDSSAQKIAVDEYFKHWDNKAADGETAETRLARREEYATLTRHYYNLATDLYEYGWGSSFHFCRFSSGESFGQAIARHEYYLAYMGSIREGMTVLDVGCGVGGPTREIAKFTGAKVIGLNNNDYQIERATRYAARDGLADKLKFVKGDFMQMAFPDNSFDAVYAIEATVHAPSLAGIYTEIARVLKPGGRFVVYEWLMTDNYDNDNLKHREIRLGIEQGNGISNMEKVSVALDAIKTAGLKLEHNEDLAERDDPAPWYWPLAGEFRYLNTVYDLFTIARMTRIGRGIIHRCLGALETVRLVPGGTQKMADSMAVAADNLVEGGRLKLFTPMYLIVAQKPEA